MTTQAPLVAGEWFNFRHVQELNILSHTTNTVRLRYDDAAEEVVRLANTAQLRVLHEILETRRHPEPGEAGGAGRKAGTWVNLRGVVSASEGTAPEAGSRLLYLSYDDGAQDDGVILSPEQADEVMQKVPSTA